jgi:hypothetical protein
MPLSMALAGPVSGAVGLTGTFLVAGLAPPVLALVAVLAWRLPADEIAHPLDLPADDLPPTDQPPTDQQATDVLTKAAGLSPPRA